MSTIHLGGRVPGCRWLALDKRLACYAAVVLLAFSLSGRAEPDEVHVSLVAEVRESIPVPAGARPLSRLVPASTLEQGQEIFYTVRIRNPASAAASDVEVVQRIPENTVYVPGSATGPGVEVSVSADGGLTWGDEGTLTVVDQSAVALMQATSLDRAALTRHAKPQDYTHVRWRLRRPLPAGAVALARFRAVFQ